MPIPVTTTRLMTLSSCLLEQSKAREIPSLPFPASGRVKAIYPPRLAGEGREEVREWPDSGRCGRQGHNIAE